MSAVGILLLLFCCVSSAAAFFKANPAMTHRLLPWLTRDLRVVLGEEHVEFMMQLIMSLIDKSVIHVRTCRLLDCNPFKSRRFQRMLIFKEF